MSEISHLPSEVIELVFSHLSYSDLGRAMQVCRKWEEVGCQPVFWRDFQLVINFKKNFEEIEFCLEGKRFSCIRRFKLLDTFLRSFGDEYREKSQIDMCLLYGLRIEDVLDKHRGDDEYRRKKFQLIWQLPRLESLDLTEYNFSSIDPDDFSIFPLNLKSLIIHGPVEINTALTSVQTQALFAGLKDQNNLTELKIVVDEWKDVDKDNFASVINSLENVELRLEDDESLLLEVLIDTMGGQDTKLRKLVLYDTDLFHIDAKKLSNALNKVESVYLCGTMLPGEALEEILKQISEKTCLKSLKITFSKGFDYEEAVEDIPDLEDLISEARLKLDSFIL